MKILQVISHFNHGGAETMCAALAQELSSKHDVLVVSLFSFNTSISESLERAGVKIVYLDKKSGFDLSMYFKLYTLLKDKHLDVVHSHLNAVKYVVPVASLVKIRRRVHTVHNIASQEADSFSRAVYKIFYKFFKLIPVALSTKVQTTIVNEYAINKNKIPVIFNGINLSRCQIKHDYAIKDIFTILHIGRFAKQKNHVGLLKAFQLFRQYYPNSVLQLIGDGDRKQEMELLVKELNIIESVEFLGIQENVFPYLHNADIFVLPSLYEGVPMTLIEAMGTALPILATAVGGVTDMLIEGESAILTDVTVEEIKNGLLRFAENEQLRKEYGLNALERSKLFSVQKMAQAYTKVYQQK